VTGTKKQAAAAPAAARDVAARCAAVMSELAAMANDENRAGMARYGIVATDAFGISLAVLRPLAKRLGTDHELAVSLWRTGNHEARLLAGMIDDPARVSEAQAEEWVLGLDSWDLCDQLCSNLLDRTGFARRKAVEWSAREEEFVKRSGFVLMAALAVHDKQARDELFLSFLPIIRREAGDDRNFVKKAVNWALRQIGKRNLALNAAAIAAANEIQAAAERGSASSRSARWIAADALRELTSDTVRQRLVRRT
jgi:3-methyladenine DNA glycosylase AlkD